MNRRNYRDPLLAIASVDGLAGRSFGCKATPPAKWETAVVTQAKHWISVRNRDAKNPLASTSEHIATARTAFRITA